MRLGVDAGGDELSFLGLQCFKFERGGFGIFTGWGRVGEDDGLHNYMAGASSAQNKCMLHFHDDLESATAEFAKVFKRHTRQDEGHDFLHASSRISRAATTSCGTRMRSCWRTAR